MLSIGKLAPGQQAYYLDTVARGAEEYYTGAKEAPGEWVGRAASVLGLSGEVDGEDLGRVLAHRHPGDGNLLTRAQGAPKVPGFDATFCAPKSVSLLFALGDPEVSNQVRNAHDTAVKAALTVLEAETARARRGHAGEQVVAADGVVAAAFRHRTSRAGDPHLHTHVLVANLVRSPVDGRWSALDARPLYAWAKTVGYLYEAQLRAELTRRLGVEWGPVRNGIADIAGVGRPVIEAFSKRREQILDQLDDWGEWSARAAQAATYATRQAKDPGDVPESLLPAWQAEAAALGLDPAALAGLTGPERALADPPDGLFARLAGPDGLTAKTSTFDRRDVIQAASAALPDGADIPTVLALSDSFLASEHAIPLDQPSPHEATSAQPHDVPVAHRPPRYTTPDMLATEERLVAAAVARRHDHAGVVPAELVAAAVAARPTLSDEQAVMVRRLTGSGAGVEVVIGVAGSGKTYALAAAREAWQAAGHHVVGVALAARAAAELQAGSGIPSGTLARFLADLDHPVSRGLAPGSVIVVDEAAMIGTRQLARLLDHADHAAAKVVLVGDHRQLPEIEAGGAFTGLARRLDPVILRQNRRQAQPWERAALAELRHGHALAAVAAYQAHDRIHLNDDPDVIRQQLVQAWWAARQAGGQHLMIATRHTQVDDLNRRARALLLEAGILTGPPIRLAGREYAVGDEVLALKNDYQLGVYNGARATITRIDQDCGDLTAQLADETTVIIPRRYTEAGHLAHGYATTNHKAQGATVSRAFVLADDTTTRSHGYAALSRGAARNDLYLLSTPDDREDPPHALEKAPTAGSLDNLVQNLSRSAAKTMALDSHRPRGATGFRRRPPALEPRIAKILQMGRPEGPPSAREVDGPDLGR